MPVVIGEYGSAAAGGAPAPGGGGGGVEIGTPGMTRVLAISGTWSEGIAPGSITVEIAGSFVDANPDFVKPGTRKVMVGGDGGSFVEFNQLWVQSSDNSEELRARGVTRITLADSRIFWANRHPFGPRAYNINVFGERAIPDSSASGGAVVGGSNKRYGAIFARTAKQILFEIFDELGVHPDHLALSASSTASVVGFVDIDGGARTGRTLQYASDQAGGVISDDMPEFVAPIQMSAGEALQKWLDLYQLSVGLSPDDPRVGLVPRGDVPGTLQALVDAVNTLPANSGRPRRNTSDGTDRDTTPDVLFIQGSKILIQQNFPLEPVLPDPDRGNTYLCLNKVETLEAYGVPMSQLYPWCQDGEECVRLAMYLTVCESPWSMVPDRWKAQAKLAFRLWREPQSSERTFDKLRPGLDAIEREDALTITVTGGGFKDTVVTRKVASAYRLLRDNTQSGIALTRSSAGSRYIADITAKTREAQPWRVTPALPFTVQRRGGKAPAALGVQSETGEDFSTGKPRLFVINGLAKYVSSQVAGASSEDWFDLNFVPGYASPQTTPGYVDPGVEPKFQDARELGIEPRLIDAQQLVWDTGIPILGSDGQRGSARLSLQMAKKAIAAAEALGSSAVGAVISGLSGAIGSVTGFFSGSTPTGTPGTLTTPAPAVKPRSKIVAMLDGSRADGKGQTLAMLYDQLELRFDAFGDPQDLCPIGTPFLWVQRSFAKSSHNDLRDWTAGVSRVPGTAGQEPMVDGRMVNGAFSSIGEIRGSKEPRQHQPIVHSHHMPDLQLRCEAVPIEDHNAFKRDGGWNSRQITGQHYYADVEFRDRASGIAFGNGEYTPVSDAHYIQVLGTMRRLVIGLDANIADFREHQDATRVVNADVMGWHRRFFPGHAGYLAAPAGQVALNVTAAGAEASMRICANSRSWRPYVGSRVHRDFAQYAAWKATTGAIAAVFAGAK